MCVRHSISYTDCDDNVVVRGPEAQPSVHTFSQDKAFLRAGRHNESFWALYRSGDAAGCCPEDGGSSPRDRQAEEDYEEEMRFRRTAVLVTERAAAGVLWRVHGGGGGG